MKTTSRTRSARCLATSVVAGVIALLVLVPGRPALAQSTDRPSGIGDTLTDIFGRALSGRPRADLQTWRGHVVQAKHTTMIFRAEDGKAYAVDMSAISAPTWQSLALGQPVPAWIERDDGRDGGRPDILSGLAGEYRRLHGHRVHGSGTTMIFVADDGTTSSVDMSAVGTAAWSSIELGQGLTLAAKPGREPNTLIAGRIHADPADRSTGKVPKRPFDDVQGTVEAVQGSQITFRTADGEIMRADASRMPGHDAIRVNERGVLTYERGRRRQVTALWLDRAEIQPSAAVAPRATGPGEYRRIHGYVQSIGWATMSLEADDGRTLAVDTSAVDPKVRDAVRPGDLVSVVGKTTAQADQFVADFIDRETRR